MHTTDVILELGSIDVMFCLDRIEPVCLGQQLTFCFYGKLWYITDRAEVGDKTIL